MPEKTFILKVVTPEQEVFKDQIISAVVPGAAGSFGVLANHAPFISQIRKGIIEIRRPDGRDVVVEVGEGYAKVKDNEMIILVTSAIIETEIPVVPR